MTGFEPRISGIRNNCSAKWATTTAQILPKCQNFDKSGHTCDAQIEASKNLEAGFSKNKTFYLIIRKKKKKQDQFCRPVNTYLAEKLQILIFSHEGHGVV